MLKTKFLCTILSIHSSHILISTYQINYAILTLEQGISELVLIRAWHKMEHFRFALRQAHLRFLHPVLHAHATRSTICFGTGTCSIRIGTRLAPSILKHFIFRTWACSSSIGMWALYHMKAWHSALNIWNLAASLVGGMSSGLLHVKKFELWQCWERTQFCL